TLLAINKCLSFFCFSSETQGARKLSLVWNLFPLADKYGDALGKHLGFLCVEAPTKFERIAPQSLTAFADYLLELYQLVAQCFIAAFLLQARQQKIEIVL